MIVETPHGEFEVKDITRKERRKYYGRVKEVYSNNNAKELHELTDEFTLVAFGSDEEADKKLDGLSALQEDEVMTAVILSYMGIESGNDTGG